MKRSTISQGDSLDLLLDTICNTFGGILFISLLVVILLNLTSKTTAVVPPSEASHATLVESEQRLRERRDRLETLTKVWEQRKKLIDRLVEPGTEELAREQQRLADDHDALSRERNEQTQQIGQEQIKINETAQRMQTLSQAIAAAQRELNAEKKELGQELAVLSRALPKQRATKKRAISFLLKQGHLCAYAKMDPSGQIVHNSHETEVLSDSVGEYIVPRISNGLKINADGSNAQAVRSKFSAFNKGQFFIEIALWSDSFEEFAAVKEVVVAEAYEIAIKLIPDDEKVRLDESSDSPFVQ